jgi:anthranilate synthase/aminodeoxychorismate synthase-like glutamine amidotransferase
VILVLDNYDSFVHNLARYVEQLGEQVRVVRNDATDVDGLLDLAPSHVIVSPGPCTPMEAGTSVDLIRVAGRLVPVLGVCLGHQCIGTAFGARVVRGPPVHGKVSSIVHEERGLFHGLPSPLSGTRYHSPPRGRPHRVRPRPVAQLPRTGAKRASTRTRARPADPREAPRSRWRDPAGRVNARSPK